MFLRNNEDQFRKVGEKGRNKGVKSIFLQVLRILKRFCGVYDDFWAGGQELFIVVSFPKCLEKNWIEGFEFLLRRWSFLESQFEEILMDQEAQKNGTANKLRIPVNSSTDSAHP